MNSKHRIIFVALTTVLTVLSLLFLYKYMAEKNEKEDICHEYSYLLQSLIKVNDLNAEGEYNDEILISPRDKPNEISPVNLEFMRFNSDFFILFDLTNQKKKFGVLPLDDTNRLIQAARQEFVSELSYCILYNEEVGSQHAPLCPTYEQLKMLGIDLNEVELGSIVPKYRYLLFGDTKWIILMKGNLTLNLNGIIAEIRNNNGNWPEMPRYIHSQSLIEDYFNDSASLYIRKFKGPLHKGYENYRDSLITYKNDYRHNKLLKLLGRNLELFRMNFIPPYKTGSYKIVISSKTNKIAGIINPLVVNMKKISVGNTYINKETVQYLLDYIKKQLSEYDLPDYQVLALTSAQFLAQGKINGN